MGGVSSGHFLEGGKKRGSYGEHGLLRSELDKYGPKLIAPLWREELVYPALALIDNTSYGALESPSHAADEFCHGA